MRCVSRSQGGLSSLLSLAVPPEPIALRLPRNRREVDRAISERLDCRAMCAEVFFETATAPLSSSSHPLSQTSHDDSTLSAPEAHPAQVRGADDSTILRIFQTQDNS